MVINSVNNDKVKFWKKLRQKKYREETGLFLIEGFNLIIEANKKNCIEELILLEGEISPIDVKPIYVNDKVLKSISKLETPSVIIAVCKKINNNEVIGNKVLALDNIQDPGNLGTIIRSAVAFSIDTIILGHDTVDIYNEKCLRASQGMIFQINILEKDLVSFLLSLKEKDYKIWGTIVNNGINIQDISVPFKYVLIVGNEGKGIKQEIKLICDKLLSIKMNNQCESLNVGVACSIILYQLSK